MARKDERDPDSRERVEPEFPADLPDPDQGLPEHPPPSPQDTPGEPLYAPLRQPGDIQERTVPTKEGKPRDTGRGS